MPPKLLSEDGRHIVIRPLAYVEERDIERYARGRAFPIIPCRLCGSQENLQRVAVKEMLADWERRHPGRLESIASSLRNVVTSHLADADAFAFDQLELQRLMRCAEQDASDEGAALAEIEPREQPFSRGLGE
jgi:tRNA 2-thiocytidine biosynthesis protein TtcA